MVRCRWRSLEFPYSIAIAMATSVGEIRITDRARFFRTDTEGCWAETRRPREKRELLELGSGSCLGTSGGSGDHQNRHP
jgi:hypothetical protein